MKTTAIILLTFFLPTTTTFSQEVKVTAERDTTYIRVLISRAEKIVETLNIDDSAKKLRVRDMIVDQYYNLSMIHDNRDDEIEKLKTLYAGNQEPMQHKAEKIRLESDEQIRLLHEEYLAKLGSELKPDQVDKVKDGMTYGVLHHTYNGYLDQYPYLTDEQKETIMNYLTEAREIAMDKGTSREKHAVFRQYKGRINNYLSAQGL